MIEVSALTKSYGGFKAVDGISFNVDKGEILGFLGPNGAGKTSTMRVLTGFMPPTSGYVKIAGFDCLTEPMEVRKRVGYLPESAPLYRDMKAREFLELAATVKGLRGDEKKMRIGETLERTGIADVSGKLISQLSKGYRQRVGLAQAIISNPEVLVLDEPTEGLDPRQIVEIRELIKETAVSGDRTVILSTHILPEVSILCDRVVIINKGKIVAVDTPANLAAKRDGKPSIEIVAAGAPEGIETALSGVNGALGVRKTESVGGEHKFIVDSTAEFDIRCSLAEAVVKAGFGLLEIKRKFLSLEDVFVEIVTSENDRQIGEDE